MASVKAVAKKPKTKAGLRNCINYVSQEEKTQGFISGINCDPQNIFSDFMATKNLYNKTDGVMCHHFSQNFKAGEVTAEKAHQIGKEFAEKNFKGHEVLVATHVDKDHIHNHFIVNSVNYENGYKFVNNPKLLDQLKLESDLICKREGLSIIQEKSKSFTTNSQGLWQSMKKYESESIKFQEGKIDKKPVPPDLLKSYVAVETAIEKALNRDQFIKNMKKLGYSVSWKDERKHITLQDQEEKKVRLSRLEKHFGNQSKLELTKEGLEKEFSKNMEKQQINTSGHQLKRNLKDVEKALEGAKSKEDLIKNLNRLGYSARWNMEGGRLELHKNGEQVSNIKASDILVEIYKRNRGEVKQDGYNEFKGADSTRYAGTQSRGSQSREVIPDGERRTGVFSRANEHFKRTSDFNRKQTDESPGAESRGQSKAWRELQQNSQSDQRHGQYNREEFLDKTTGRIDESSKSNQWSGAENNPGIEQLNREISSEGSNEFKREIENSFSDSRDQHDISVNRDNSNEPNKIEEQQEKDNQAKEHDLER